MIKKTPEEALAARRESQRKYTATHREQERAKNQQWHETHKEEKAEYRRKYNESHKEQQREYAEAHREEQHERQRKYRETHRELLREAQQKYREANPEKIRESNRRYSGTHRDPETLSKRNLKQHYGVTDEEAARLLTERQTGVCTICGEVRGKVGLVVDHDHKTGKVRGVICGKCNSGLGFFADNSEWLRRAADYNDKAGISTD